MSGVFNWVLEGLNRLLQNQRFTECKAVNEARQAYEIQSDSTKLFLQENEYKASSDHFIKIKELYQLYRQFCIEDGYKPVKKTNFIKRLKNHGIYIDKKNVGNVAFIKSNLKALA